MSRIKGSIPWNKGKKTSTEQRVKFFQSIKAKPNKLETNFDSLLTMLLPNQYRFVGDGQFIIDGLCPDFINVNGKKKAININGEFWHRKDNNQELIDRYKSYGFDLLVLWDYEMKNIPTISQKILDFNDGLPVTILSSKYPADYKPTHRKKGIQKGQKLSKEHKEALAKSHKGRIFDESTREKIRQSVRESWLKRSHVHTQEEKDKISKGLLKSGRVYQPLSEEQKAQISKTLTGRKLSPEAYQNFIEAINKPEYIANNKLTHTGTGQRKVKRHGYSVHLI